MPNRFLDAAQGTEPIDETMPLAAESPSQPKAFTLPPPHIFSTIRAVVCLSIVAFHLFPRSSLSEWPFETETFPSPLWLVTHVRFGYASFFVIAGYFLAHSFREARSYLSVKAYLVRRFLRIAVPYWVAFVVFEIVGVRLGDLYHSRPPSITAFECLASLAFMSDLIGGMGIGSHLWFMSALMQFYVLWCAAFWIVRQRYFIAGVADHHGNSLRVMAGLMVGVIAASVATNFFVSGDGWYLAKNAHYLALGCLTYWASANMIPHVLVFAGIAVELALGAKLPSSRPIAAAVMTSILLGLAHWPELSRWKPRLINAIGIRSYSIYLTHGFVGGRLERFLIEDAGTPAVIAWLAAIVGCVAVGFLFYALVERSIDRLTRGLNYRG